MKKINENTKVTLTVGQLKKLVKESNNDEESNNDVYDDKMTLSKLIKILQEVMDKNGDIEVRYMDSPIFNVREKPMTNWGEDWIRIE